MFPEILAKKRAAFARDRLAALAGGVLEPDPINDGDLAAPIAHGSAAQMGDSFARTIDDFRLSIVRLPPRAET